MAAKTPDPSKIDAVAQAMAKIGKAQAAAAAMEKAREKMGLMTNAAKAAAREQEKLAKAQERTAKATERAAEREAKAQARAQATAAKKATKAAEKAASEDAAAMAEAEATAIAAVEAAAVAAAAAVLALVAAVGALAAKAIEIVQMREGLAATFAALGGGGTAGAQTLAMVDTLSKKLPFASEQIAGWAKSLQSAGFQGDRLKSAVEAVAAATAIMGESGGAAAEKMMKQLSEGGAAADKMLKAIQKGSPKSARLLADMGLHVQDVASAMGMTVAQFQKANIGADQMNAALQKALAAKGSNRLSAMMLEWPVIIQKAREGFLSLFEKLGPSIKPFMTAVQRLFGQFTRGTPTMRALQKVVTEVFGALFKYGTMAVQVITKFVKQNLSAKNIGSTWKEIKGAISTVAKALITVWKYLGPIFKSPLFLKGIATVFKVIGIVVLVVVGALGALTAITGLVAGAFGTLGAILWGIIGTLIEWAASAVSAGSDFVEGIINGITSGAGALIDAVSNLARSALNTFKSILGIASPSKVMMAMGGHVAAGASEGIDKGAPGVADSAAKLGGAVTGGAAAGMGGAGGGAKGSLTVNGGLHVHVTGGTSAEIAEEALALIVERLAASQGLGVGA